MIDLYYDATPNGRKALIMLEETGLPYTLNWVEIGKGHQFEPEFMAISPNSKIPAIVDHDGPGGETVSVFETGAILLYLAEKTGKFLSQDPIERLEAIKWLFWQTSSQGPFVGQAVHFINYAADRGIDDTYAIERYHAEAKKLYGVLDNRLSDRDYIAGDFSIADIATFPWVRVAKGHRIDVTEYPNVQRWSAAISERPSTKVKPKIPDSDASFERIDGSDDKVWKNLFDHESKAEAAATKTGS